MPVMNYEPGVLPDQGRLDRWREQGGVWIGAHAVCLHCCVERPRIPNADQPIWYPWKQGPVAWVDFFTATHPPVPEKYQDEWEPDTDEGWRYYHEQEVERKWEDGRFMLDRGFPFLHVNTTPLLTRHTGWVLQLKRKAPPRAKVPLGFVQTRPWQAFSLRTIPQAEDDILLFASGRQWFPSDVDLPLPGSQVCYIRPADWSDLKGVDLDVTHNRILVSHEDRPEVIGYVAQIDPDENPVDGWWYAAGGRGDPAPSFPAAVCELLKLADILPS